jgi:hypothetical protein
MYSQADVDKQAGAQTLFRSCTGRMVVSTQVVQEFYVAGTRKLGLSATQGSGGRGRLVGASVGHYRSGADPIGYQL